MCFIGAFLLRKRKMPQVAVKLQGGSSNFFCICFVLVRKYRIPESVNGEDAPGFDLHGASRVLREPAGVLSSVRTVELPR